MKKSKSNFTNSVYAVIALTVIFISPTLATGGCILVNNDLDLKICAEYQGVKYEFTLKYNPIESDPQGLYWKMDISTFKQSVGSNDCISVNSDLDLKLCATYQGINYEFTLKYNPVSSDSQSLYWKMDIITFKPVDSNLTCNDGTFPIAISDISTVDRCEMGHSYEATLTYRGDLEKMKNPMVLPKMLFKGGSSITVGDSNRPEVMDGCKLKFEFYIPTDFTNGNVTFYFRVVDCEGLRECTNSWEQENASNIVTKDIYIYKSF